MYAFIEGIVDSKGQGELVVNAGGVGYVLACSSSTIAQAPAAGEKFRAYTVLSVREDAMELFGFATRAEKDMFRKLTNVTGIGARTALGILSAMSLRDLSVALVTGDATALSRAPGIGKKTAQRMILELRDKVEQQDIPSAAAGAAAPVQMGAEQEAAAALMSLGYTSAEAARAINLVRDRADTPDKLIMLALQSLGGM